MGVIIGASTTVNFGGKPVTQVSWGINPNIQRAYVLGDWSPYTDAQVKAPTETMNLTVYTPGPTYSTVPTETCTDANTIVATISPAICGNTASGPSSSDWFVNSYSYSKGDARTPGTESWSLLQYVTLEDATVTLPTYVLRGISEGSVTSDSTGGAALAGITFYGDVDVGSTGSVSAGQVGRADNQYTGVISAVGGSSAGSGDIVSGNCSMPYTPLYL